MESKFLFVHSSLNQEIDIMKLFKKADFLTYICILFSVNGALSYETEVNKLRMSKRVENKRTLRP